MTASSEQLIYEVNLEIDPAIAGDYDPWLEEHVRDMLGLPGFLSAEILHIEAEQEDAWPRRSVRYVVASREALEDYLREHAPRMRAAGEERFGDRFKANRRILEEKDRLAPAGGELIECPNCETPLNGQYCWQCGQRSRVRLITLGELLRDALGDLFELDSRLWRSVFPLLFRPGKLTHDYLEGRRARYMPPFRMYLVISILFFLIWNMTTGGFNVNLDEDDLAGIDVATDALNERLARLEQRQADDPDPERQQQIEILRETLDRLTEPQLDENGEPEFRMSGGINIDFSSDDEASDDEGLDNETLDAISGASPEVEAVESESNATAESATTTETMATETAISESATAANEEAASNRRTRRNWQCDEIEFEDAVPILSKLLGREALVEACEKMERDSGASFLKALFDNLPAMMFLFLPLLALAIKALYLGSGRYYVEHLLFTVHYHAFFFLIVSLTVLVHTFQGAMHLPDWVVGIFTAVVVLYIQPVYLYKALRRVYHQGHIVTTLKWFVLSIAYLVALVLTIVVGMAITALTL